MNKAAIERMFGRGAITCAALFALSSAFIPKSASAQTAGSGTYDGTNISFYQYDTGFRSSGNGTLNIIPIPDPNNPSGPPKTQGPGPMSIIMDAGATVSGDEFFTYRTMVSEATINTVWIPDSPTNTRAPSIQPSYAFPMILGATASVSSSDDNYTEGYVFHRCNSQVYQNGSQVTPDPSNGAGNEVIWSTMYGGVNATSGSPSYNSAPRVRGNYQSVLHLSTQTTFDLKAGYNRTASASAHVNAGMAMVYLDPIFD